MRPTLLPPIVISKKTRGRDISYYWKSIINFYRIYRRVCVDYILEKNTIKKLKEYYSTKSEEGKDGRRRESNPPLVHRCKLFTTMKLLFNPTCDRELWRKL